MRVVLTAIGLILIWQGLNFSLFIKATRNVLALIERHSNTELQRAGVAVFLVGLLVLACVT